MRILLSAHHLHSLAAIAAAVTRLLQNCRSRSMNAVLYVNTIAYYK